MSSNTVLHEVREVLAREWNIPVGDVPDQARLGHFEPWDSMGHVQVILALQNRFGFDLSAELLQELVSIEKIVSFVTGIAVADPQH